MADGVAITAGSGTTVATDDAGASGHVQIVKLALSADGSATAITADANGLEVQGSGTAGTPAGGVVTIQGVTSGTAVGVKETRASTGTLSTVNDTASSTTLLASNGSRIAAVIFNDSTANLYVKYGATASATSFTYKLGPSETLRESVYTGVIDGIWSADASGAARITELTA